jgi:N-acetylmuramoyl-L-alanine amidase
LSNVKGKTVFFINDSTVSIISDLALLLTHEKRKQELSEKVSIANNLKANLFLSVHINSATPTAHGTETFYSTAQSNELAQIMHKHLLKATGFTDRGVKTKGLYVTRYTKMPSTLVEIGFLSNQMKTPASRLLPKKQGYIGGIVLYLDIQKPE